MTAPHTERDDVVETLHGHQVSDPYRWLEDPDSDRTRAWVEAQREWCEQVFADIPERAWFQERMDQLVRQARASTPWHRGGWYLRLVNNGSQDQDVLVGARSLDELVSSPRVLLDPNGWSEDGTTCLAVARLSPDGRLLAHGISEAGSDWTRIRVLDIESMELLPDDVMAKFSWPEWLPDSSGFFYTSFPDSGRAEGTETQALAEGHLMLHRLGRQDDEDLLSFPEDRRRMIHVEVHRGSSQDWAVCTLGHGTARETALWVAPLQDGALGEWIELEPDEDAGRWTIGVHGAELFCVVDEDAPRRRVVAYDLGAPNDPPRVVVPEGEATLEGAVLADGVLVVSSLVDASPNLERWSVSGERLGQVAVTGGAVVGLNAEPDSSEVFLGLSSVTSPTVVHRLDASSGELSELPSQARVAMPGVRVERHRATSADGTGVPYFLITPEVPTAEGPCPTLLYGYGGFSIPVLADYRAGWAGWLAAGGQLVIANLRGGGEFGQEWADQGKKTHKQNVFDDAIGVAEHLVATGVTTPEQLAVYGRSNGGLLVGAVMTQRPDLFAAAIPQVGVLDLLRFHLFTIGAAWASDYGNPEDAEDFATALGWSPLHNVREGERYPATLVVTGDHDDRVVPAHSHKFTAALQAVQDADPRRPIASRIEVATGHGAGKPLGMQAAEWADVLAFAAHFTGLEPSGSAVLDR
ncbi:prolyl oligopeptidase family serine peptidase [Aestuariimicrobium sp. p3-SID1156]|uniref:prolyl oligopeptidase family serine peptidase n=1 Tax=Aestuariimicrobium sp. p3-SID1156 TaxID=2916038 RepID=UPI00223BD4D3|nr:prolyl oligopeptidase family serine peptidase [Aestuariimicrobium sp. p3-SID1156]MCT1460172.1 prolyl oligopeptidase family serine peptidase [Aestuariimicrobium sp. p3-SID1156]